MVPVRTELPDAEKAGAVWSADFQRAALGDGYAAVVDAVEGRPHLRAAGQVAQLLLNGAQAVEDVLRDCCH